MSDWKTVTLGERAKEITVGFVGPMASEYVGKGIPFLRSQNVIPFSIDYDGIKYISEEFHKKLKKSALTPGDVVIVRTGKPGASAVIPKSLPVVNCSDLVIVRCGDKLDPNFISYYINSITKSHVDANLVGAVQQHFNVGAAKQILIPDIDIVHQRNIASVLSSLDDKIDLLHRQNATLEAMAETLFRQWFVEEAKENWEVKSLSSIADFLNGLACQKFPPKNDLEKLPVLKIKDLSSGITENSDWASTEVKPEYIVRNGDVIFAWSASLMVKIWNGDDCILNQHLFKVTSPIYPKWFYYLWCKFHLEEFISKAASHATTMGHIKRGDLDEAIVIVPSKNELKEMTLTIHPIMDKLIINNNQIRTLTALRDTLLPKLMSGEIRVEM